MKAIILAAGRGTRLRPLTDDKPKCLVELAGKPLLEHQLETLRAGGVDDIHIVGGYRAEQLERPDTTLHLNPRYAETNMVSTLFAAEAVMTGDADLIIGYGDIVYEPRVLAALQAVEAPIALAVDREWRRYWAARMDDPLADAETLKLTDGDRVVELGKEPQSYDDIQGQYTGLIKIRADHVARLSEVWRAMDRDATYDGKDFDNMYMTSFIQHLIDSGWEARAAFIDNGWAEVDCEADISVATRFWQPDLLFVEVPTSKYGRNKMRSIALILRTHLIDPDAECVIKDSIEEGVDEVIVFTPDVDETSKFVAARGWDSCVLVYRGAGPKSKKFGFYNSWVCFSYMLKAGVVISEEPLALKKERIFARAFGVFVFQLVDGVVTKRKAFISHKCCSADNKEMKSIKNNSKVRAVLRKIIKSIKMPFGLVQRRLHHVGYDVVTASSDLDAIVSKARVPYKARDGKLFVFPLPRFRLFEERANANKPLTKKKVNILFAPTKIKEGEFDEELLSCNELIELKEKNDFEYLYRGHVKEQKEKNLSGFEYANDNAFLGLNLCDYLQDADVLVTDYSSIYVDSLPFGLPVIFFKTKQSNQALPDKIFWPGPVVNSTQELADAISDAVKLRGEFWIEEREVAYRVLVSERKESVFRVVSEAR